MTAPKPHEPMVDEPVADNHMADEPVADEPIADQAAADADAEDAHGGVALEVDGGDDDDQEDDQEDDHDGDDQEAPRGEDGRIIAAEEKKNGNMRYRWNRLGGRARALQLVENALANPQAVPDPAELPRLLGALEAFMYEATDGENGRSALALAELWLALAPGSLCALRGKAHALDTLWMDADDRPEEHPDLQEHDVLQRLLAAELEVFAHDHGGDVVAKACDRLGVLHTLSFFDDKVCARALSCPSRLLLFHFSGGVRRRVGMQHAESIAWSEMIIADNDTPASCLPRAYSELAKAYMKLGNLEAERNARLQQRAALGHDGHNEERLAALDRQLAAGDAHLGAAAME